MKRSTTWLRISYWVGAVADGIVAAVMFAQAILALPSPLTRYLPETPYRYAMGLAGSLMLGWTILLLWADRRPVERRGILIITIVVILGLMGSSVFSLSAGFMPARSVVPLLAFQIALIALFSASHALSRREHGSITSEKA
jgi:drug/metabolite transporter (DMT)-like permease